MIGIVNQARILGGTIGLACSTIILNVTINKELDGVLTTAELNNLRQTVAEIPSLSSGQQVVVRQVFAHAFEDQMRVCMYVGVVSVLTSFLVFSRHPIDFKKRITLQEEVLHGRITPDEADRLLRAR